MTQAWIEITGDDGAKHCINTARLISVTRGPNGGTLLHFPQTRWAIKDSYETIKSALQGGVDLPLPPGPAP